MRQGVCLTLGIVIYFIVHEGAHAFVAMHYGVLKKVNVMLMGIQVDVYHEQMTDVQMGLFCLAGAVATLAVAWLLVLLSVYVLSRASMREPWRGMLRSFCWFSTPCTCRCCMALWAVAT